MTHDEVKNLVEDLLKKSGWVVTEETTEDGAIIVRGE